MKHERWKSLNHDSWCQQEADKTNLLDYYSPFFCAKYIEIQLEKVKEKTL